MIAHPTRGNVRVEWNQGRYGQIVPVNWSQVQVEQMLNSYYPLHFQVDDAQNMIVKKFIEMDFEWLLLWEDDVIPPPGALQTLNDYMRDAEIPVVSGLYYTKSVPAEPLIFRGSGLGAYTKFKIGEMVWCDGVPTGFLLIHQSILRVMWDESEEYQLENTITRRVFETPRKTWFVPGDNGRDFVNTYSGTSDLYWCKRVMEEKMFKKAGWPKFQRKKYPFLCDTSIFCRHIQPDGRQFP
jgi:hypothetical protein